jgi:sigma-B regulation protein RsbU (phosphoserine phosphatase)
MMFRSGKGYGMRIVVADDDPTLLMVISAILTKFGYQVLKASNGAEALDILRREEVRIIVSDWAMPGMDGLELCRHIRSQNNDRYVYFILLTARDDKPSLVKGMEAGADDFLVKPVDTEELRVRVRAGERILDLKEKLEARNRELDQLNKDLQKAYHTISADMEAAAATQKALLPKPALLNGLSFDWLFRPSSFVAGDMFGYFPLTENAVGFYQLDVAGHGISSALLSFTLSKVLLQSSDEIGLLHYTANGEHDGEVTPPPEVLRELNRRFVSDDDAVLYFTMVYGIIEPQTGAVTLTQAGHPSPMCLRRRERRCDLLGEGGFPVGMIAQAEYDSIDVQLEPGDRLFLYSDGITECENPSGEPFGEDRLRTLLEAATDVSLATAIKWVGEAIDDWRADESFEDDISMLVLERSHAH